MSHLYPSHLKFTEDHEWADLKNDIATVGITDFAQSALGDIVYVELPEEGSEVSKGDSFGVVESIKSVSCLLYTSPSPRDRQKSRMPSSA